MNLDKLKDTARRFELREEWRRAIDTYHRAVGDLHAAGEPVDPALFNRIGDLEVKAGDPGAALEAYRQAAELYGEQGFFNNAIALYGKILRVDGGQTDVYLRLAHLHARKNVLPEARRNLGYYLERMVAAGRTPEATRELQAFATRFSASQELLAALTELFDQVSSDEVTAPDFEALAAPETARAAPPPPDPLRAAASGLVFIDTGFGPPPAAGEGRPEGLEPTAVEADPADAVSPLSGFEPTAVETTPDDPGLASLREPMVAEPMEVEGLEPTAAEPGEEPGPPGEPLPIVYHPLFEGLEVETWTDEAPERRRAAPVPGSAGGRSVVALERALAGEEAAEQWDLAIATVGELLRRDPDNLHWHQKRVELAYRVHDRNLLIGAYLSLGHALARSGAHANARMVYQRVLEHDPGNAGASAAIAASEAGAPPGAAPPGSGDYVDLGALILEDGPMDTRMRVGQPEVVGDEDRDFLETLAQFKQGIEANLDVEDFQAHYDLGIAYKEMGLLDEAIAQFQRALRAPEGKLKTTEALGVAFFEKGRFAITEGILRRAVEALPGADEQKVALLYWLGRAVEAQGRSGDAVAWYERAMAVDIRFHDVSDRLHRLTAGDRT